MRQREISYGLVERAAAAGIRPATLVHPWNRRLCERDARIVCGEDWPRLAERLDPVLDGGGVPGAGSRP